VNDTCDACYPHMRATIIARDHTDHSTRIRRCNEQSNKSVPLSSPPPSLADFTINTSAYDFRKGQVNRAIETIGRIMPVPILGGFHREYVQI
jgi:hypothetical protein